MAANEPELKALFLRGLAGDSQAHGAFLREIAGYVRAFLRRRMRDPGEAEDLVQETVLAIHTKRDTYDPAYPVTAWVYAIARYRLIDRVRRRQRQGVEIPAEDVAELFSADEIQAAEARRDVRQLLERLPAKQRDAIRLVKLEEVSVRDAAARTGLSESDIKISIHRGLKTLMRLMGEKEPA